MNPSTVTEYIEHLLSLDLPFAVYRKPEKNEISAIAQEDDTLHFATDFKESGFVFAPFDNIDKTVIIPGDEVQTLLLDPDVETGDLSMVLPKINDEDKRDHIAMVNDAVTCIKQTEMRKVVLSRKQTIATAASVAEILTRLLQSYPTAFVYCWYHPKIGLWMGATPETLLLVANRRLQTMSLAGTQTFSGTEQVAWGTKELEEQQMVTDTIVARLKPLLTTVEISEVGTQRAGSLLHLLTTISGIVDVSKVSLKAIIEALHPTPAVCGLPKELAKKFILENESYDREYYSGFLGELNMKSVRTRARNRRNVENLAYTSITKNTHLFVNLRCMQLREDTAQVYVGGGITAASDSEAEWEETVNKLATMGKVL